MSHYVCFLSAQQFFLSKENNNDKVLKRILKYESSNIVDFLASVIKEILAYDPQFNMAQNRLKTKTSTMGFKNCSFGKKVSVQEANTDPRRQDDCD